MITYLESMDTLTQAAKTASRNCTSKDDVKSVPAPNPVDVLKGLGIHSKQYPSEAERPKATTRVAQRHLGAAKSAPRVLKEMEKEQRKEEHASEAFLKTHYDSVSD
jgi:uncharacterized ParB-like nuclease family protein